MCVCARPSPAVRLEPKRKHFGHVFLGDLSVIAQASTLVFCSVQQDPLDKIRRFTSLLDMAGGFASPETRPMASEGGGGRGLLEDHFPLAGKSLVGSMLDQQSYQSSCKDVYDPTKRSHTDPYSPILTHTHPYSPILTHADPY